jgi:hypothetical protein
MSPYLNFRGAMNWHPTDSPCSSRSPMVGDHPKAQNNITITTLSNSHSNISIVSFASLEINFFLGYGVSISIITYIRHFLLIYEVHIPAAHALAF